MKNKTLSLILLTILIAGWIPFPSAVAQDSAAANLEPIGPQPPPRVSGAIQSAISDLEPLDQTGGHTFAVDTLGSYAYIDVGSRLMVMDISNPNKPAVVGQTEFLPEMIADIWVEDSLAYLSAGTAGLQIISLANPANPRLIGSLATDRNSLGVHISGDYAYVAGRDGGMLIVDVSNPTKPFQVGVYSMATAWAHDIWVADSYAYVAAGKEGVHLVDVQDPANPIFIKVVNTGNTLGLGANGSYLYAAAGSEVAILDIADPGNPAELGVAEIGKGTAVGVEADDSYAYVAATDGGLRVINVITPTAPFEESAFQRLDGAMNVSIVGDNAYVAGGWDNLQVIDVSEPDHLRRVGRYETLGGAQGVDVVGDYVYLGAGQDGSWIIDVDDPNDMRPVGVYDTEGSCRGIKVVDSYAYLACGADGLHVMDVSTVTAPVQVGWYTETISNARQLDVVSDTLYLADRETVMNIDVTNPATPTLQGFKSTPGSARAVHTVGDYAYVAVGGAGLLVLDATQPNLPQIGHLDTVSNTWDVYVEDDIAYVAAGLDGLWIVDVSNKAHPEHISTYKVDGYGIGVYAAGPTVYLAAGLGGVHIIDVKNPYAPMLTASYDTPGYSEDVFYSSGTVYLADAAGGLFAFSLYQTVTPLAPNVSLSRAGASFLGEGRDSLAGGVVAGLGDINDDEMDDFAIAAAGQGQVYLFFGKQRGWPGDSISLENANASLLGEQPADSFGSSVAAAGDVNGDGIADFIIGASGNSQVEPSAGQVYLVLGSADPNDWRRGMPITQAAVASFTGEAGGDRAGTGAAGVGDVNNDSFDDFMIGSPQNDEAGDDGGQVYLIFGRDAGWSMDTSLADADASFLGTGAHTSAGESLTYVGDLNDDEFDDLVIGARLENSADANSGTVFVIMGKEEDWAMDTPLTSSDASFEGESLGDWAGFSLAGVGSVNGDKYNDFVIGAPGDDFRGRQTGTAYLILGNRSDWRMHTSLADAHASFVGEGQGSWVGYAVAGAGDVNDDGYDDLLIGATGDSPGGRDAGQTYLVFGRPTPEWHYGMELYNADASFWGETTNDTSGQSVAGVGDVDGDGFGDFMIGAPNRSETSNNAGKAYLLFGNNGPAAGAFAPQIPFEDINIYSALTSTYYDLADGYSDLEEMSLTLQGGGKEVDLSYVTSENRLYMGEQSCIQGQPGALHNGVFELDCLNSTISNDGEKQISIHWQLRVLEAVVWPYQLDATLQARDASMNQSRSHLAGFWNIAPDAAAADLSQIDTSFWGEGDHDRAGWAVAPAGDVNDDGFNDILIGAPNYDISGTITTTKPNSGKVYLFLGNQDGWEADLSLSNADASFVGEVEDNYAGFALDGVGDVDDDGYDDILIGAYRTRDIGVTAGKAYLVRGRPTEQWTLDTSLAQADASYLAETGSDYAGYAVSAAGDVNDDGYNDFLIGAWGRERENGNQAGMAYLILGKPTGWYTNTSLSQADASFLGEDGDDWASFSLAGVGDVNQDNYDDFLVSAPNDETAGEQAGQVYLFLGKAGGWYTNTSVSEADASFLGKAAGDMAGIAVSAAGDVNDDDYDDFVIGAWGADGGIGPETGVSYLILGHSDWYTGVSLLEADAAFIGQRPYDRSGRALTSLGDINGDNHHDFAIGAYGANDGGLDAGKVYVILGQEQYLGKSYFLSQADQMFWGQEAIDYAGLSLAGVQDVAGLGFRGLLVGAPGNKENGQYNSGQVYLVTLATLDPPPTLNSVTPSTIINDQENPVTLYGSNFQSPLTVRVGTTIVSSTRWSATEVEARIPANFPAGVYDLSVTNPDGQIGELDDALTILNPPPVLQSAVPPTVTNHLAHTITLTGLYFLETPTVTLSSVPFPMETSFVSSHTVTFTLPERFVAGVYTITLANPDGQSGSLPEALTVYYPKPVLESVEPFTITNNISQTITLNGINFQRLPAVSTVLVGESSVAVTYVSSRTLYATVPAGFPTGLYTVTVINPDGQGSSLENALYVELGSPMLQSIDPSTVTNQLSWSITINGVNFQATPTVTVGSDLMGASFVSSRTVTFTLPSRFTPDVYTVTLTNPNGQEGSLANGLTVIYPPPVLESLDPPAITNEVTQVVKLRGLHFRPAPTVTVGNVQLEATRSSSRTVRMAVPANFPAGIHDVTIINSDGQQDSLPNALTVAFLPPILESVTPPVISNEISKTVLLTGVYFQETPTVTVGSNLVDVSFVTSRTLWITTPMNLPPDTYTVTVTNPDGQTSSLSNTLTVVLYPAPELDLVEPVQFSNRITQVITLTGRYFRSMPKVMVGDNQLATSFISSSTLTATIPAGFTAGVYTVKIANPDGQQAQWDGVLTVLQQVYLPLVLRAPAAKTQSSSRGVIRLVAQ